MTGKKGKGGDESLWDAVTRDVQPLKGREPAPVLPAPVPPAPADTPPRRPAENAPAAPPRAPLPIPPPPRAPDLPEITAGRAPGLDQRTAQRMRRGQVVGDYEDAWRMLRENNKKSGGAMPRTAAFVTGPSRTADIEQTIQLGAHGPRRLHIVLIDGDDGQEG